MAKGSILSMNYIFIVTAYRWGDYKSHSYVLGVFDSEEMARNAAYIEEEHRGGKYECEILKGQINYWKHTEGIMKNVFEIIKKR